MPNTNTVQVGPTANPMLAADPNYMIRVMQAQRQQRIADALTQQGMAPIDYDPKGRISPLQGINKMLAAALGGYMGNKSIENQANLNAQGMQLSAAQLGAGQPAAASVPAPSNAQIALGQGAQSGSVGPTISNGQRMDSMPAQTPAAPSIPGSVQPTPMNPYGLPPNLILAARMGDPEAQKMLETMLKSQEMTNEQKNSRDPMIGSSVVGNLQTQNMTNLQKLQLARSRVPAGSLQARQLDAAIGKENYIQPLDAKPGTPLLDPLSREPFFFAPKTAEGINLDFKDPLHPTAAAIPGYAGANASIAGAEQGARQANTVFTGVPGTDGLPQSGFLFGGGGGGGARPAASSAPQISPSNNSAPGAPTQPAAPARPSGRPGVIVGPDPTVQAGRINLQGDMSKRWGDLYGQASQAQTVNSYLDQIKSLAPVADTGQFSDRQEFVNSLLSKAGSERATDAVTAKNLLDKYSNQIVARLGGGAMGTDAARQILASAYPGSHMTQQAISEAVESLKSANRMAQAKAQVLQPHYNNADPTSYNRTEIQFDQNADPRIFQWKAIKDPAQRKAFGAAMIKQDPTLLQKAHNLEAMGVQ